MYKKSVLPLVLWSCLQLIRTCHSALLHEDCIRNSECKVDLSHCTEAISKCICRPYTVEYNSTTCLPGTLLGFECQIDAQCAAKVPTSGCVNGVCSCDHGSVPYRRHTCLPPAKFGEICFDNDQCAIADQGTQCKFVVPRVFGRCHCAPGKQFDVARKQCVSKGVKIGQTCQIDKDCTVPNAYCQRKMNGDTICTCEIAYSPSSDGSRCLPTYRGLLSATSLGYPCHANLQCQLHDPNSICNNAGVCDCVAPNSTSCSAENTGCHPSTFQCHTGGSCISYYYVCDGNKDCAGKDAEDEIGCTGKGSCPPGTFQCQDSACLPEHHFCSVQDCKDDSQCRLEFQPSEFCPFRCANGLCRSSAVVCSGVNGCGDNSDEAPCSVCRCPRVS